MHPIIRDNQKTQLKKVPEIKPGYTVRVHQKIKEGNKERVQVFEGLVIKVGHGEGVERTFTVRKIVEGIGVEKIFLIHSSNITKIEVKKKAKVRRSKLYYMRERFGKSARLRERHVTDEERAAEEARMEALVQEAVQVEDERKKAEEADASEKAEVTEDAQERTAEEPKAEEVSDQPEDKKEDQAISESPAEEADDSKKEAV